MAPPTGEPQPPASGPLEENLEGIGEVAPITLKLPSPQEAAPDQAGQQAPEKSPRKYCFIATAAYGTPLAEEVVVLQDFRDAYLAGNPLGKRCIEAYYRLGPYLARRISRHKTLQQLTRFVLTPIILLLKKSPRPAGK